LIYSQWITERNSNNIYTYTKLYDWFLHKQVYVEKEGIPNIWIEANDAQIKKRQWSRNARNICIIFLQKIDKQVLVLFEYLTVPLDKISNKKKYFENDESFYIVNIEKGHYIQEYK